MTPATEAKAAAIRAALSNEPFHKERPNTKAAALLAMLTSANKEERESGKREVRELVKIGADVLQADQDAADLANFANRHEP